MIAAVPTLLVVIFASLLFQYGVEFWFSDRARTVLENADSVAQAYVEENKQRIVADVVSMGGDVNGYSSTFGIDRRASPRGFAWQVAARNLSEAAVIAIGRDGDRRLIAGANLDKRAARAAAADAARSASCATAARASSPMPATGWRRWCGSIRRPESISMPRATSIRRCCPRSARARSALGDYNSDDRAVAARSSCSSTSRCCSCRC